MKSSANSKIIILITFGILFAFSPIIATNLSFIAGNNNKSSEYNAENNLDEENLITSVISGKIRIINNSGWVDFKNAGNCTREGTYSDPYVIEDLEIDGGFLGSGIWIENSDVYFKIENCYIFHSYDGIQLTNVENSLIISNDCSSNNNNGIDISGCNNNTISGNTANNNNRNGIYVGGGGNNVFGNTANNNEYGIHVGGSVNNGNDSISGNTANNNWNSGIYVNGGGNYSIAGNIMNECGLRIKGSFEELISNNIDITNQVNGKPLYYYTNEINLVENNFTNAGQVILVNCNDSLISNLNVSYCTRGISLFYCNNNTMSGNIANNNEYGIRLFAGVYNTVSGSTVNNNYMGIYLSGCNNSIISGNTANNNIMGIILIFSDYNTVSGNTANNNNCGIKLSGSHYNTISRNTANNNIYGINLFASYYNTISGNIFLGNDKCIEENYCEGNIFENNDCGKGDGIIPGYNLFFILGILAVVPIIISRKLKKS